MTASVVCRLKQRAFFIIFDMVAAMLQDIKNFLLIHPSLGTGGQPTAKQLAAVQSAGFEVVINLVPASSPEALPAEQSIVTSLGMEYFHIPVIWDAPTRQDLDRFFAVLDQNQERGVFAHCVLNFRVSTFVFLYRVLNHGIKMEKARRTMLEIWEPNPTWQRFIQEQLQSVVVPSNQTNQEPEDTGQRRPDA
jgi:protein tyrosine phosphatase (PTP) superfamily phosphohydrolase (DUF442 family)